MDYCLVYYLVYCLVYYLDYCLVYYLLETESCFTEP